MKRNAMMVILLLALQAASQTQQKEPDVLQSLLAEVHGLRLEIQAMTVASQRSQIALSSLEMQDAAVARSAQRLDGIRTKCLDLEAGRQHVAADIQRLENHVSTGTPEDNAKIKEVEAVLPQVKIDLEAKTAESQACQAREAEAAGQLQNDQAKLAELQDRLDRLDKTLQQSLAGK
jgi:chromosome segregation ATPase